MSEDLEKAIPETDPGQHDDDDDVEAHNFKPAAEAAATEEGPDVEGHEFHPKTHPKAQP